MRSKWLNPQSLPKLFAITAMDMDITQKCNFRCRYCFKGDRERRPSATMSLDMALAAIDWLLEASSHAVNLDISFMGGEPLLQFELIKKVVPYGKRRAWTRGKAIQFSATTNMSLLNEEIVQFWDYWGMGWHASIDGVPVIQNYQRPFSHGGTTSDIVENNAKLILRYRPTCMARATIMEEMISHLYESYQYLKKLGFLSIGISPAEIASWTPKSLSNWREQERLIFDDVIDSFRKGELIFYAPIEFFFKILSGEKKQGDVFGCGAGRGMSLLDPEGNIWPCHRWDGADIDSEAEGKWRLGNIFEGWFNDELHLAILQRDVRATRKQSCGNCECISFCTGGCPAGNIQETGSMYELHDNWCQITRINYAESKRAYEILKEEKNPLLWKRFLPSLKVEDKRNVYYMREAPSPKQSVLKLKRERRW
ncbi:MAG: SPASM domain-containing protein [Candidatus Omnitrophota bacterium]|jgi:uncharacterized protein|nr:MAG: SPASM domain-containing protein [Candidatus Omnitrophota bacterium]